MFLILRILELYRIHKYGEIVEASIIPFYNDNNWIYFKYLYQDMEFKKYYKVTNLEIMKKYNLNKNYDVFRQLVVESISVIFNKHNPKRCIPCDVMYGIEEKNG